MCCEAKIISNVITFTPLRNGYLITFKKMRKQPPEKFCKKAVFKEFCNIHRKAPVLEPFLIQNIAKYSRAPILKNICERLLLKTFMKPVTTMKLRNIKNC